VGGFGAFSGEGFVVVFDGFGRVEAEGELVAPAEFETGLGDGVVSDLGGRVSLGEVGGVGADLVGDDTFANVLAVGEAEVLFWSHVAEHSTAIPADVSRSDA